MEEGRSACKMITGKSIGKRPLGRPRHRQENNIRIDIYGIGVTRRNWLNLSQDRGYWRVLVNAALNLWVL